MKKFVAYILLAITLSSCLKQTIADAMLDKEVQISNGSAMSMSYMVNGELVKTELNDATNGASGFRKLYCQKSAYSYGLALGSNTGQLYFTFYTDSLKTINYLYKGSYGNQHFLWYKGTDGFTRYASDSMSFNVTSYVDRRISGNFSGRLTPLIGGTADTYGPAGSILITNGRFENIPVLY